MAAVSNLASGGNFGRVQFAPMANQYNSKSAFCNLSTNDQTQWNTLRGSTNYYQSWPPSQTIPNTNHFGNSFSYQSGVPNLGNSTINPNVMQPLVPSNSQAYQSVHPFKFGTQGKNIPIISAAAPAEPLITGNQIAARHVVPKDLPYFWGKSKEWPMFISAYETTTSTCGYTNSENLPRLQKCLKGKAYDLVNSRLLHPDSVPGVIETLRLMFGRSEQIINGVLSDIQKEPSPKNNDLNSLIKFAVSVKNLSGTIQAIKADEQLRNPILMRQLTDKLPMQIQINWAYFKQTVGVGNATVETLADWLYGLAEVTADVTALDESSNEKKDKKDNKESKSNNESKKPQPNNFLNAQTGSSNASEDKSSSSTKNTKCPACNIQSCTKLYNCTKFKEMNPKDKYTLVKNSKLCFSLSLQQNL